VLPHNTKRPSQAASSWLPWWQLGRASLVMRPLDKASPPHYQIFSCYLPSSSLVGRGREERRRGSGSSSDMVVQDLGGVGHRWCWLLAGIVLIGAFLQWLISGSACHPAGLNSCRAAAPLLLQRRPTQVVHSWQLYGGWIGRSPDLLKSEEEEAAQGPNRVLHLVAGFSMHFYRTLLL
jgi:hypothetical protein